MKRFYLGLMALSLVAFIGCGDSSSGTSNKVGGPGATNTTDRSGSILGPKEGEFELDPPTFSKTIKQGTSDVVTMGIKRGKNFDEDVALAFEDVPKNVTIDPSAAVIKKGDKDVKLTVKAGDDAGLGKHTIKVMGKPSKGPGVTSSFDIKIENK